MRCPSSGSIESPKQDKTEETYTKTHYIICHSQDKESI